MNINEQNFIKEIRKRNTRALDYIVDNYSNLVFKIVGSVLNSSFYFQHVEECANDVFWSVWNNIESFDEDKGEFKHWIAAISKYKAIDYKRKLFKESIVEDIDDYYNLCDEISTENTVLSKENRKEVLNAINNMKDEDREIFIRRYFLYEGVENIAKIFGVNRNSIDKRLSRGRKVLKKDLMHLKGEIL
ncbi:DNA-directed RNA polymerase sigma-70 factor [Clostridium tetani]|uniref:sigma-70 family RNA polymerase sigma factor n=1 Tax=Clostridium tetani TaxID=1513 RepID=UPI00031DAF92|nr:sigma-70 family RNA polymerase sigma factor [Clostridium tetani]AVP54319.1 RNA polymerase subunit sigma-70 [Clostridium tetani]KGI37721.1 RNA polymerase sigma70 factor [Clostridium tetani]KGI39647.1 RNA polymerase sigma70 factor [Clostridium tetani ATCC 9441]KGI44192.1 RNA polymerase sigma70 factor [Clostridium tetani]KGI45558.1 RNA polymerase sigma70 factor [Clostridium tetani]